MIKSQPNGYGCRRKLLQFFNSFARGIASLSTDIFGKSYNRDKAMLKISSKNIEQCTRKSKKGPILVLSWLVLSWLVLSRLVLSCLIIVTVVALALHKFTVHVSHLLLKACKYDSAVRSGGKSNHCQAFTWLEMIYYILYLEVTLLIVLQIIILGERTCGNRWLQNEKHATSTNLLIKCWRYLC